MSFLIFVYAMISAQEVMGGSNKLYCITIINLFLCVHTLSVFFGISIYIFTCMNPKLKLNLYFVTRWQHNKVDLLSFIG